MVLFVFVVCPYFAVFLMFHLGPAGYVVAFIFYFCWTPLKSYSNPENTYDYDNMNPLYVKGFLRKNPPKLSILNKLEGIYFCQNISAVLMACLFIYLGYCYLNGIQRFFLIEIIFELCFAGLFIIRSFFQIYYSQSYNNAYRYSQNKNGIWTPFSFVFKEHSGNYFKSFSCNYHVSFDKIMETLGESCRTNGYHFCERYKTDDKTELSFFTRHSSNRLDILSIVHVDILEIEHWDKFNEVFEVYWKNFVEGKYEFEESRFTFLLCIDNRCKQLRKINNLHSIDQKKGRYRLPAVLSYYHNDTLSICPICSRLRGQKQYNEMRKELLSMLKVSET